MGETQKPIYQIVITVDYPTDDQIGDLKYITKDIIEVLQDTKMNARDHNYEELLKLLENMIPDQKIFKELE